MMLPRRGGVRAHVAAAPVWYWTPASTTDTGTKSPAGNKIVRSSVWSTSSALPGDLAAAAGVVLWTRGPSPAGTDGTIIEVVSSSSDGPQVGDDVTALPVEITPPAPVPPVSVSPAPRTVPAPAADAGSDNTVFYLAGVALAGLFLLIAKKA